jgi:hypothetical protein
MYEINAFGNLRNLEQKMIRVITKKGKYDIPETNFEVVTFEALRN